MEKTIELLPKQLEFFNLKDKQAGLLSGVGAGKSYVLMLSFILNEIVQYPQAKHCFAALSYGQLRDASIPLFIGLLEDLGIPYKHNMSTHNFIVNGKTEVLFRSLDTSSKMRSVEIGSLYIEELSYAKYIDFTAFLGRLRDKKGSLRFRTAFTANGTDHFTYNYFIELKKAALVKMSTYDNIFLPSDYIQMLEASYDDLTRRQELDAEFVSISQNKVYYCFSREQHARDINVRGDLLGLDFNVNPLCGIVCKRVGDIIYVTDEYYLENSNTYELTDQVFEDYGNIRVVADSTGNSRRTSATKTDHQVLNEGGLRVQRFRNPRVKDRINNLNNRLYKNQIVIDTNCKMLLRDLDKLTRDNKDSNLSHISDALGYAVYYLFPPEFLQNKSKTYKL